MRKTLIRGKRLRVCYLPNWKNRPHPYWFYRKYEFGARQLDMPFISIYIKSKPV